MNWAPRVGRIRGIDIRFHLTLLAVVAYWVLNGAVVVDQCCPPETG